MPLYYKRCTHCLKEFETNIETKKYCTKPCKLKEKSIRTRESRNNNKRQKKENIRKENTVFKNCVICDKEFTTHLNKNYCSPECNYIRNQLKGKKPCPTCNKIHHPNCLLPKKIKVKKIKKIVHKTKVEIRTVKCAQCSYVFQTMSRNKKFCMKSCSNAFNRPEPKFYKKSCLSCTKGFETKYIQKSFCSRDCWSKIPTKYTRKTRFCVVCKEEISTRKNKYCEKHKPCNQVEIRNCINCKVDITGTSCKKYCRKCSIKILKNKSGYYKKLAVKIKKQWREEGRVCVWCKSQEITIDHIIPVSKGGPLMDRNNMQPLCHVCNVSKGNKLAPYDCSRYIKYRKYP